MRTRLPRPASARPVVVLSVTATILTAVAGFWLVREVQRQRQRTLVSTPLDNLAEMLIDVFMEWRQRAREGR